MTLLGVILSVLMLSVLVVLHELGHFLVARFFGVTVEEFGVGLPPRIVGIKRKKWKTMLSLNWIPFGGFVRLKGEDGGSKDKDAFGSKSLRAQAAIVGAGVAVNLFIAWIVLTLGFGLGMEPLLVNQKDFMDALSDGTVQVEFKPESKEDSMSLGRLAIEGDLLKDYGILSGDVLLSWEGKPVFQFSDLQDFWEPMHATWSDLKLYRPSTGEIVTIAGGIKNPVTKGERSWREEGVVLNYFEKDSPAVAAGLKVGDLVQSVNGAVVAQPEDVVAATKGQTGKVHYEVLRDGQAVTADFELREDGRAGVGLAPAYQTEGLIAYFELLPHEFIGIQPVQKSWTEAPGYALHEMGRLGWATVKMFGGVIGNLLTAQGVPAGVSGPVGIIQAVSASAHDGFTAIIRLVALLSLSLGVINVLPIPALDGGRLLFIVLRGITGKKDEHNHWEAWVHTVGFFFLLLLIVYLTVNDVSNLI